MGKKKKKLCYSVVLLVSVGAVARLGGRVRQLLPRPRSLNVSARHAPGGLPRARAELRVRRVHRGRGASGARRRAQGAEQREHLRVGVRPGVLPCRMGLRQLQHAGAGVSARPALARVQQASGRGLHGVPGKCWFAAGKFIGKWDFESASFPGPRLDKQGVRYSPETFLG